MKRIIASLFLLVGLFLFGQSFAKDKPPIPLGVKLYIAPMQGNLDNYIAGEMSKQKVPMTIVDDATAADYTLTGTENQEGKSFSARSVLGLRVHYRDEVQAAVRLVRNSDHVVVWAGDSDRGESKKVAEHIVNQMLKQRPMWLPSPINR